MTAFITDSEFLLNTETGRKLYHQYAVKMPIVDYHCHIDPQEIWENRRFDNAKIATPAPSARSFSTTLPEF